MINEKTLVTKCDKKPMGEHFKYNKTNHFQKTAYLGDTELLVQQQFHTGISVLKKKKEKKKQAIKTMYFFS